MDIATNLIFNEFQGGRFYRGRYVYSVAVELPIIGYSWWDDRVTCKTFRELKSYADSTEARKWITQIRERRDVRSILHYGFTDDTIAAKLFGLTALQFFNRMLRYKKIVAVDRGKAGWWYMQHDLLPLIRYRKKSHHVIGRIDKDKRELFAPIFIEPTEKIFEESVPGDFGYYASRQWPLPDYAALDLGPDRLPEVWVCNLCEHTAVLNKWPIDNGLLGDYIHHCPACQAAGADAFHRIVDSAHDTIKFKPYRRMQDELYFTI